MRTRVFQYYVRGCRGGAVEKWCRIVAIHRLKFFGPKVWKTVLGTSCWCLRHENDPERWSARPRARAHARAPGRAPGQGNLSVLVSILQCMSAQRFLMASCSFMIAPRKLISCCSQYLRTSNCVCKCAPTTWLLQSAINASWGEC